MGRCILSLTIRRRTTSSAIQVPRSAPCTLSAGYTSRRSTKGFFALSSLVCPLTDTRESLRGHADGRTEEDYTRYHGPTTRATLTTPTSGRAYASPLSPVHTRRRAYARAECGACAPAAPRWRCFKFVTCLRMARASYMTAAFDICCLDGRKRARNLGPPTSRPATKYRIRAIMFGIGQVCSARTRILRCVSAYHDASTPPTAHSTTTHRSLHPLLESRDLRRRQ